MWRYGTHKFLHVTSTGDATRSKICTESGSETSETMAALEYTCSILCIKLCAGSHMCRYSHLKLRIRRCVPVTSYRLVPEIPRR